MKHYINYILYGIALVMILIPIGKNEIMHSLMAPIGQTIFFSIGLLFLLAGKIIRIRQKRSETGEPIFQDIVISICLIAIIIWMFIR